MQAVADYFWRLIPANPILLRVVEAGGKRRRDLFIRCIYLGLLVGLVLLAIASSGNQAGQTSLSTLAKTSSNIFQKMSYLQLALVALLAPIFTAGAITQEKDSQTYDILLCTPLTNAQIVLGSLLSRLYFIVALLISGIPIFSITQIFGGVAIRSIMQSFGIAAATAFVTGSLAMAIATFKVGTRRTIFSFYLFIVAYLAGLIVLDQFPAFHPVIGQDPTTLAPIRSTTGWVTPFNPLLALQTLFNDPAHTPPKFQTLPDDLRHWPVGWMLNNPASFYTSLMFLLSFIMVAPSIVMLRRIAQSSATDKSLIRLVLASVLTVLGVSSLIIGVPGAVYFAGVMVVCIALSLLPWLMDGSWMDLFRPAKEEVVGAATAGPRPIGRAPRSRKPRTVGNNPIAWREAKTKASAGRGSLMRYGFMLAGLVGAVFMVFRFSQVQEPRSAIGPGSFNADQMQLTIDTDVYQVPAFVDTPEYAITRLDPDAQGENGAPVYKPFDLHELAGRLEVAKFESSAAPVVGASKVISLLQLCPIRRGISAADVRKYLLGLCIIEFAVILLIVTNAAASTVTREKEDGTLDLLLCSPITSRYYIWGKLRGLVSFVMPLVAVPVASVAMFVIYDLLRWAAGNEPGFQWIVFPEALALLPLMLIIVSAFAAILGMQMSLRCRTTVMAVMSSVGIVVGVCAAMGWCGYAVLKDAGYNWVPVGLGTFSPFTLMQVLINPYTTTGNAFRAAYGSEDPTSTNRIAIVICTLIAVSAYTAIVWSMYQSMVKNFDMTIRKQSR